MEVKLKMVLGFLNLGLALSLRESSLTKCEIRTRYEEDLGAWKGVSSTEHI